MKNKTIFSLSFFVLLAVIIIFVFIFGTIHVPNAGQHTGYVTSVEESGIISKTWTAYIKTDPQSSQEDSYCVTDLSTINQLQTASKNRTPVTVDYSAPLIVWKWQCGSEQSIINAVESSNNTGNNDTTNNLTPTSNSSVANDNNVSRCAEDANRYFSSGNYLLKNVSSNSTYINHYDKLLNKCFIEISFSVTQSSYGGESLYDVDSGIMWGFFTIGFNSHTGEMSQSTTSCFVNENGDGTKKNNCSSQSEFGALTKGYMTD
jgi:hypothetical protein